MFKQVKHTNDMQSTIMMLGHAQSTTYQNYYYYYFLQKTNNTNRQIKRQICLPHPQTKMAHCPQCD
jgi:hypothetical protein